MTRNKLTADEIIRPIEDVTCGKCGRSDCTIYPIEPEKDRQAATFCPTCSPSWSQSFFAFLTDQYRDGLGLSRLEP
jgi:ribosomal protein S27AE